MSYFFSVNHGKFEYSNDELEKHEIAGVFYFSKNILSSEVGKIIEAYKKKKIVDFFNNFEKDNFLFILFSKDRREFLVFNDKISSNELFFCVKNSVFYCSNDVKTILSKAEMKMEIDRDNLFEQLIFSSILPPKTIFKNIKVVPSANLLKFDTRNNESKLQRYWEMSKLFLPKEKNYNTLIKNIQSILKKGLVNENVEDIAISLSGGIDSGGLLGYLTYLTGKPIKSFSVGPHGPDSHDLKSARKIVEHDNSSNIEIYPKFDDLKELPVFLKNLNQPIDAHFVFFNALIFKQSEELNVKKMIYGFGTNLTLGTQMINRAPYIMEKIEKIFPKFFLKIIYKIVSVFKKHSKNKAKFLQTFSWEKRWLQTKTPTLVHEEHFYKKFNKKIVVDDYEFFLKDLWEKPGIDIVEKVIMAEYVMWTMHLQFSNLHYLSKKYNVIPVIPFDTVTMANVIFKTPNRFRRINNWDKQVVRDVFKPFVSDDLYKNKPKSGVIPYTKWFLGKEKKIFKYLRRSKIINMAIDLDLFEKEYGRISKSGSVIMKYLGLAVWYDVNWNKENVGKFFKIFDTLKKE